MFRCAALSSFLLACALLLFALPTLAQDPEDSNPPEGTDPTADEPPAEPGTPSRMAVRVIAGRLVARVELSTRFRRIPANLWIDFDRPVGLELHNRAAFPLGVDRDGGQPITVHLLGKNLVLSEREHGDEELMEAFTKLYSRDLGEVALIGTIGSRVLEQYHLVIDVRDGFITLTSPAEQTGAAPPEEGGSIVAAATLTNDLVWFPVRLEGGELRAMAIGTSRYDTIIDSELCRERERPAGDIGPVVIKTIDLHQFVAMRPEPLVQVHSDGALGVAGLNLLEHFRVEIDRVNRFIRFAETAPAEFPAADLTFFRARLEEAPEPLIAFLEEHGETRLSREAATLLLDLQIELGADADGCRIALEWLDKTRIEDLRTTEALATMKALIESRRVDLAIEAGRIGVESGRKDRYPEAVHKLHTKLGELLLDEGDPDAAWEHLLSAAFGLPDEGEVNLLLGRLYEKKERWRRAQSRYIQAVIKPETGPQAIAGLERVQERMAGESLSVDLVDRMVRGKVHNFSAATKYEPDAEAEAETNRCVLVELFTNPHFGRKQGEAWESFAIGGSMAIEGILSHYPRERAVVLVHHVDIPEPCALMTELGMTAFGAYGLQGPTATVLNGSQFGPGAERWRNAEGVYESNRELVLSELRNRSEYSIAIEATATPDGTVQGTVRVEGSDEKLRRVQVILAERGVLYPGKALIVVHRMVARGSLLGSLDGVRLEPEDGTHTIAFSRTLKEMTDENVAFLDQYEANGGNPASRLSVAIDPRQVSIVAFIRDVTTQEVLQAAQLDLGDTEPEGALR